jgi:hypothetical protein
LVLRLFHREKLQNLRPLRVIRRSSREFAQALKVLLVHESVHLATPGWRLAPWADFGGKLAVGLDHGPATPSDTAKNDE